MREHSAYLLQPKLAAETAPSRLEGYPHPYQWLTLAFHALKLSNLLTKKRSRSPIAGVIDLTRAVDPENTP